MVTSFKTRYIYLIDGLNIGSFLLFYLNKYLNPQNLFYTYSKNDALLKKLMDDKMWNRGYLNWA